MPSKEQLSFLRASLERWRVEGLIDEPTFERLLAHGIGAADDPADTGERDPELAAEVAFHARLEHEALAAEQAAADARAALDRVPVAERPAHLGDALLAAAADLAGAPAGVHPEHELTGSRALEHSILAHDARTSPPSLWDSALRPFLVANAMWLAGALLIIAGSVYFLRLAWDYLSSVPLHMVVAGTLHAYAAAFFATGYLLARKQEAHGVGRILFAFACGILPLGSVAVGELVVVAVAAWGAGGVALALLSVAVSLLVQGFILALVAGLYERAALRLTVTTGLWLAALIMATRIADAALVRWAPDVPATAVLVPLGLAALAHGFLGLPRHRVHLRMSILLHGGAMLWAFAVLLVRAQVLAPLAVTRHAVFLAALAALLVVTDHRLRMRASDTPRLTELNIGFHVASLAALALALVGLGVHGYFDVVARVNVLACALVATALFGQGAWRYGRSLMTWLAAGAGLLVYFFLPAPFTALLRLAQDWVTSALGYTDTPMPVAFYGLLFVPYLAALCAVRLRLRARHPERRDLVSDLERFVIALSVLLVLVAMLGDGDLRPVLWTWPIYAVAAFAGARPLARPWLLHAGHGLTLAWLHVAISAPGPANASAPALAAYGLAAALAVGRWRDAGHLVFAALAGAAGAALAAPLGPWLDLTVWPGWPSFAVASITVVLIGVTLARLAQVRRWAWCAHAAAAAGVVATVLACIHVDVSVAGFRAVLLVHAAVYAAVAHAVRRAGSDDARWRLLARPAMIGAILALVPVWASALIWQAHGVLLLIALMFAHLACLSRGVLLTLVAAAAGVWAVAYGALGLDDAGVFPDAWPLALAALGCVYLVLAACVPRAWPAADGRRTIVALAGLSVLVVGLGTALSFAAELGDSLGWWWRSLAGLGAFTAVAAGLWWRAAYWARLWGGLWPPAFVATVQAGMVTLAVALSTGRHPDAAVMALMAPAAFLTARALHALARRWRAQRDVGLMAETGFVTLLGAGVLAGAAVVGCVPAVPGFVSVLGLLTLAAVAGVLVRDGLRAGSAAYVYLALVAVTAWYVVARLCPPLAAASEGLDAVVVVAASVLALWAGKRLAPDGRLAALRVPLRVAALLWPLAAAGLMGELGPTARILLGFVVAAHYAAASRLLGTRGPLPLAMGFGNAALLLTFASLGWSDALLYAVPVAASALVLVHVYGPELGKHGRNTARTLVLMVLYVLALAQALVQVTPLQSLVVVPLMCVAAIAAGTLLRVRVYVLVGVAFLAADLGANLLRYGLQSRLLGALFLTALGLVIVAGMVYFSVQRERLMRRYSSIMGTLRTWD